MTGPKENVKLFGLRPLEAVAGLVPGGRHCIPIMAALPGLGIETDIVGVLHGADGLRILDPNGSSSSSRAGVTTPRSSSSTTKACARVSR
jgi:hypothetical protein